VIRAVGGKDCELEVIIKAVCRVDVTRTCVLQVAQVFRVIHQFIHKSILWVPTGGGFVLWVDCVEIPAFCRPVAVGRRPCDQQAHQFFHTGRSQSSAESFIGEERDHSDSQLLRSTWVAGEGLSEDLAERNEPGSMPNRWTRVSQGPVAGRCLCLKSVRWPVGLDWWGGRSELQTPEAHRPFRQCWSVISRTFKRHWVLSMLCNH
jgi:hypothetical protein